MKKLHVHLFVNDIDKSTEFYNQLFSTSPSLNKDDYVRWELTDPALNFAISNKGKAGIDHLGIQVENEHELQNLLKPINQTAQDIDAPEKTSCCYAHSNKTWAEDPQGISWELFHTYHNEESFYGQQSDSACCANSSCCS